MTIKLAPLISYPLPSITWEKLPAAFFLSDEPVESTLQPLLAAAFRESLKLAGLIFEASLITSIYRVAAGLKAMGIDLEAE